MDNSTETDPIAAANIGTRADHLAWCKCRALEYCARGEINEAIASMGSDMGKHPGTANHPAIGLMLQLHLMGEFPTAQAARKFIEGFN